MTTCKYCGKYFKPLGIMTHRASCRRKHERKEGQSKLEVDYSIRKKEEKDEE